MLHDLLVAQPGSLIRFRVLQILLPEFGDRDFNGFCILTPLDLCNPQCVKLLRLTSVGSSCALLNPLALDIKIRVPDAAALVECHGSSFYLLPASSSVEEASKTRSISSGSKRNARPSFTKGIRRRYTQL